MIKRLICLLLISFVAFVALAVHAQDTDPTPNTRDPLALAQRYLGFNGVVSLPPLTPIYAIGDTAQFWVAKADSASPVRISATLAAVAPNAYLWVEDGVNADVKTDAALPQTALRLSSIVNALRTRDNFRQQPIAPGGIEITDPADLLPVPDIDNDPHLYILYTTHLSTSREAIFNPIDSLPTEVAPYSNQHEMLYISTTPYPGKPLSDPLYASKLIRAIYRWIINNNLPDQAAWLTEMLNWAIFMDIQQQSVASDDLRIYFQSPDISLTQPTSSVNELGGLAEQHLFLNYFTQRYGSATVTDLFLQHGTGMTALDNVLKQRNIVDPATGAPATGRDTYTDFIMTNAINAAIGDGRYAYRVQLPTGLAAGPTLLEPGKQQTDLTVNQFGAKYFAYTNQDANAATVSLTFAGNPTSPRLSMPADRDPADKFYWSGRAVDQDATLTRAVDLSAVSKATLTFDAWYDLARDWNYGYVSASTDDGATWKPLTASNSGVSNQNGTAYGAGFTGVSNPAQPQSFPNLGILVETDAVTVYAVAPSGAAAAAGIQKGDVIFGYDSKAWPDTPNVFALVAKYAPGDTLHLFVQHDGPPTDYPVIVGARVVEPPPLWLPQTVDLTPYAGRKILLRFEAVTLPGHDDQGFAVDNLAIPEIQWSDKADGNLSGWTVSDWQQVDNQVAQHWVVQSVSTGSQTAAPRVQTLLKSSPDQRADVASNGVWRFSLAPSESIIFAVTSVNDDTDQPAAFSLGLKN